MSLLESLLRLIDPIEYRARVAQRRRVQDPRPDQPDPDTSVTVPPAIEREVERRCRVCGLAADTAYCLVCLADTMEEV
ncbi:MAG TPA: hypothetical protein VK698_14945 [Kofleriaceae bacterium]|nr:hypothetical protein [Kofleriaceae bacterium]